MLAYPARYAPDEGNVVLAQVPDLPAVQTFGQGQAEAESMALDAAKLVLAIYMEERRDIPAPSPMPRTSPDSDGWTYRMLQLPALVSAKVALYRAMRDQGVSELELARQLKLDSGRSGVERLLNPLITSPLDLLEQALEVLGKRLLVTVQDAA